MCPLQTNTESRQGVATLSGVVISSALSVFEIVFYFSATNLNAIVSPCRTSVALTPHPVLKIDRPRFTPFRLQNREKGAETVGH